MKSSEPTEFGGDIPDGDYFVYVLQCKADSDAPIVPHSEKTYRLKSSHGLGEPHSDIPVDFYQPRTWSRVAVCSGGEELFPLYVELARYADNIYYVGITEDPETRFSQHWRSGSGFTRHMAIEEVVTLEGFTNTAPDEYGWKRTARDLAKRREDQLGNALNFGLTKDSEEGPVVDLENLYSFAHSDQGVGWTNPLL